MRPLWGRALWLVVLLAGTVGGCQQQVERGVQKAAEKKIDQRMYGGGTTGGAAETYAEHLAFEMVARRIGENEVRIDGIVRNTGNRTVTHLEVSVGLLDASGVQVAGRTDWFAHTLPFGENNTPLMPGQAKRVGCRINDSGRWTSGAVDVRVLSVALK
jgi:hypothetical protein